MNRLIHLYLTIVFIACLSGSVAGQGYESAVGIRFGYPTAVTYKKHFSEKTAVDLFAGFVSSHYWSSFDAGLIIQFHYPIEVANVDNLNWYWGLGGRVSFWNYNDRFYRYYYYRYWDQEDKGTGFGIMGNVGAQYTFDDLPLNVSIDWMPGFMIHGIYYHRGFTGSYGGVTARYVLSR